MEEWRYIKGFENYYMVSNYGRVKRVGNYRNQNKSWSSTDIILSAGNNGRG